MRKTVLITGGAGFIGRHTTNALVAAGCHVRVLDNLSPQVHLDRKASIAALPPEVEFIHGDVCNRSVVATALEGAHIVYHMAAETGVGQSMYEIERYTRVNIQGTAVLGDCIAKKKGRLEKLILSSSRAVYGEGEYECANCEKVYPDGRTREQLKAASWDPLCPRCGNNIIPIACRETTPCRPSSIYGFTKKAQEDLVSIFSAAYQVPVVILRYFNVFGRGQSVANPYTGVLTIFCSRLLANKSIEIYEDGQMQRDFVPIYDVVEANVKALAIDDSGVFVLNVGSGLPKTILQISKGLKAQVVSSSAITVSGRYRVGDVRHCYAEMSKAQNVIGHTSNGSFDRCIKELVTWARTQGTDSLLEKSIGELSDYGLTGITKDP